MKKPKSVLENIIGFVSNPNKVIDMAHTINDSYKLIINTKDVYIEMKKNPEDFLKKAANSVLDSTARVVDRKLKERYDHGYQGKETTRKDSKK